MPHGGSLAQIFEDKDPAGSSDVAVCGETELGDYIDATAFAQYCEAAVPCVPTLVDPPAHTQASIHVVAVHAATQHSMSEGGRVTARA